MAESLQLLKGTLDVLVLKALSWGPMHGFGVAGWIEQGTAGDLTVEVDDEIRFHLDARAEQLARLGLTTGEALRGE